jgi:hypothetical protein
MFDINSIEDQFIEYCSIFYYCDREFSWNLSSAGGFNTSKSDFDLKIIKGNDCTILISSIEWNYDTTRVFINDIEIIYSMRSTGFVYCYGMYHGFESSVIYEFC